MASNVSEEETFQCSKCDQFLDLASKTLPCLHSFCRACVEMVIEGNRLCPQCQQSVTGDDLRLAPFLVKTVRRRQLGSREWRCDSCFEENGAESTVQIWCQECEKFLCNDCERFHPRHETKDMSGVSRVESIRVITTDNCRRHRQPKDAFCKRCNVCLCKECYRDHVTASPQCPPRPLSVREEASKEKKFGPTLDRELRQFEIQIMKTNERTKRSIEQLSRDCDSERIKLTQDFEEFVEDARLKLGELCDNMRLMASELERQWRRSLKEREELLGKVKIWRDTLEHLLKDDADDEDVICGLRLVRAELSAPLRQSFAPPEKIRWVVTFPKWCHDSLESLEKEIADWTAETAGHLQLEREFPLQGSNPLWFISTIVTSDEDNHVFVGDGDSGSILEFGDSGELVDQCRLTDGEERLCPRDMCRPTEDMLIVCCSGGSKGGRIFFLARQKSPPFFKKQRTIDTKEKKFSLLIGTLKKLFVLMKMDKK